MALYSKCCTCGIRIPYRSTRCDKCQAEWSKVQNKNRDKAIQDFRGSKWWKIKRKKIMKDYHYACQICKHNGINREADEVHHIIPLSIDFERRLDDSNLIPLCEECHEAVHNEEVNIPRGYIETF